MIKFSIFSLLLFLSLSDLVAQDIIILQDSTKIPCKIIKIQEDDITYHINELDIDFVMQIKNISKVILSNGEVINYNYWSDTAGYEKAKKSSIKFGFTSPMFGYTDLSYERSFRPKTSTEVAIGLIGLGFPNANRESIGLSFRLGNKFYARQVKQVAPKDWSALDGSYVKPELALAGYERDNELIYAGAILINAGREWVFDNVLVMDLYFGLGYGLSTDISSYVTKYGFFASNDPNLPIAFSIGFRIGILLN